MYMLASHPSSLCTCVGASRSAVGDVIEMEGNETGLVLRRDDGFLYQQHIQVSDPESAPDEDVGY